MEKGEKHCSKLNPSIKNNICVRVAMINVSVHVWECG